MALNFNSLLLGFHAFYLIAFVRQKVKCSAGLAGNLFPNVDVDHAVDHINLD